MSGFEPRTYKVVEATALPTEPQLEHEIEFLNRSVYEII